MTRTDPTQNADHAVGRFVLVALGIPAAITIVALAVQFAILPQLPDPVATHWGADGVDGYGPVWVPLLLTAVVGFGLPALIALACLPGLRRGDRGPTYRFMGANAASLSMLLGATTTIGLLLQRGLDDAADTPGIGPWMLLAFALAILIGVLAWFLQPRQEHPVAAPSTDTGPLPLAPAERAVWIRSVSIARGASIVLGAVVLLLVVLTAVTWVVADAAVGWLLAGISAFLLALIATSLVFRVSVDEHGLSVVSVAGVPRFQVPLAEVEAVRVVPVNPMGEFGGWGLRWAPGRFGVVLRTGPAIEVDRANGRQFVVTVDDAETGARLLQALADRAATADGGDGPMEHRHGR
ncbi:DUF1648 domain-containing protein [Agromyces seonyuensis]|uniref:DUF1648 domain-containing protein n=1 Tax=Agromyces seonyuensis TaxID=2662446 RepID=A0A6I4NRC1_9MICO|nr:DUF1648 domain-containing protein [Agromyces seonyuensis]MWB97008.1 DUF1648 domain-containing protein [Agromyces seonyuensis]